MSERQLGLGMQSGPDLFLPLTTLIYHSRGVWCAEGVASHMTADSFNSISFFIKSVFIIFALISRVFLSIRSVMFCIYNSYINRVMLRVNFFI